jgi:hypothetical protein
VGNRRASARKRPRDPLEGRGKQADVSAEGNIDGTQNPFSLCPRNSTE